MSFIASEQAFELSCFLNKILSLFELGRIELLWEDAPFVLNSTEFDKQKKIIKIVNDLTGIPVNSLRLEVYTLLIFLEALIPGTTMSNEAIIRVIFFFISIGHSVQEEPQKHEKFKEPRLSRHCRIRLQSTPVPADMDHLHTPDCLLQ